MIPTEPIGSIPRPPYLIAALETTNSDDPSLDPLYDRATRDTIERFAATGSPVITDGEQRKYHNFWTYSVHGLPNTSPDGFRIPFAAGHTRRMPRLESGPFQYRRYADSFVETARRYTDLPLKQAIISASALSLMYPADAIAGYSRDEFIDALIAEHIAEIRRCFASGAYKVQIDFTEGRLAVKLDPSGGLLHTFIDLNNLALSRLTQAERNMLGVHTCPGGDRDSTHSADADYAELLPGLFELKTGSFYVSLAGEPDRIRILKVIRQHLKPGQNVFVGSLKRPTTFPSHSSAPPTTAGSRRSRMTRRRRVRRRLPRSKRAWTEQSWHPRPLDSHDGIARRRRRTTPLGGAQERQHDPAGAAAGGRRARPHQGGAPRKPGAADRGARRVGHLHVPVEYRDGGD
jgi:5-methyltetrahydropteroyltriglutamate--homocysteine methyltransferase